MYHHYHIVCTHRSSFVIDILERIINSTDQPSYHKWTGVSRVSSHRRFIMAKRDIWEGLSRRLVRYWTSMISSTQWMHHAVWAMPSAAYSSAVCMLSRCHRSHVKNVVFFLLFSSIAVLSFVSPNEFLFETSNVMTPVALTYFANEDCSTVSLITNSVVKRRRRLVDFFYAVLFFLTTTKLPPTSIDCCCMLHIRSQPVSESSTTTSSP